MSEKPKPSSGADPAREGEPGTGAGGAGDARDKAGKVPEIGGRTGPDPTRYGDWEKNGRCIDF